MFKIKALMALGLVGFSLQAADDSKSDQSIDVHQDLSRAHRLIDLLYRELPKINCHGISEFRILDDRRNGYYRNLQRVESGLYLVADDGVPNKIVGTFGTLTDFFGSVSYDSKGGDIRKVTEKALEQAGVEVLSQETTTDFKTGLVVGHRYQIGKIEERN